MMKKLLLGKKEYMTQVFDTDGRARAATVISAGPVVVTQVKTSATDGYDALQLGFGEKKAKHTLKPQQGHFKKAGNTMFRYVREIRTAGTDQSAHIGDKFFVADVLSVGDMVTVSGISKAKGFQGVVKRHGFSGGPRSHGQAHNERSPGSIGGGLRRRVPKGMRMGGRMGGDMVTIKNLTVLAIDAHTHTIIVSGAVPGRRGTLVEIRKHA